MKWLKLFENFKQNNIEGDLLKQDDIIKGGIIWATIVQEIPENNPKDPLLVIDIDEDGLITVEQNNKIGYVKIEDVEKIEF
jgi:hypothetical protein